MSVLIHHDHGRTLHPVRTFAVAVVASVVVAVLAALAPVGIAHAARFVDTAKPAGLTVDRHGRVILSALRHCREEDGSGRRHACTWNVGPLRHGLTSDGNGRGLAYYFRAPQHGDRPHYVWNRDPVQGHPRNRWLSRAMRQDFRAHADRNRHRPWNRCYLHVAGTDTVRCPNGDWYTAS